MWAGPSVGGAFSRQSVCIAHVLHAQQQLLALLSDLLSEAGETGRLRVDVSPDELATFCLHPLAAASALRSEAAVRRLVGVTLSGMVKTDGPTTR